MNKTRISYNLSNLRIVLGIIIFFIPTTSDFFFVPFLLTGIIDFTGEGLLKLDSEVYGKDKLLNSIGTLIFVIAGSYRLLPELLLSTTIHSWLLLIALLVVWNLLSEYFLYGRLIYVDSSATRVVKALIYCFPLFVKFINKEFLCLLICVAATFAEMQLGHSIRMKSSELQIKENQ